MSNCIAGQAVWMDSPRGFPVFALTLRMARGFRMQAARATFRRSQMAMRR